MIGVPLNRGPYDGAQFTFVDRLPERILLEIECMDVDATDPDFQEAYRANLAGSSTLELSVIVRNAKSLTTVYLLEEDHDGAPYYRFSGWALTGSESSK